MTVNYASATVEWGDPASPDTITLLDLLKQILGVTDNSQDTHLSLMLDMSGRAIEQYIDNKVVKREVFEQFKQRFYPIALRFWPVGQLIKVAINDEDVTDQYELTYEDGIGWAMKPANTGVRKETPFDQLTVTYEAGYDPLPSDLGYAIVQGAISYNASNETGSGAGQGSLRKESIVGVGSREWDTSSSAGDIVGLLPGSVTAVISHYRRMNA